jgi:T-complex protein 1 subunit delta
MPEGGSMTTMMRPQPTSHAFKDKDKPAEVRQSNITAAKAVADAVRSSLGPKGMDKMIISPDKSVIVSNDGATILKHMSVLHPCAKMLVELSAAQDVEAGDGTTSVVVFAGSLLAQAEKLLEKGIHPSAIAESFQNASKKAVQFLHQISIPCDISNRESLVQSATTSLSSKVVSQHSSKLAPIAVDAVLRIIDSKVATNVDLRDIRIVTKVGGTMEDIELVEGLVLTQTVNKQAAESLTRVEKARIGLCQFHLSAPKTDMDNQISVSDYRQMDRILKEERDYLLDMCKKIKKSGCNVLLVQKSILRDAVNELSLHFLSKLKIMVITDIERDEVEFISKTLGCRPIADIQSFTEDRLGYANLVEEVQDEGSKIVKITGLKSNASATGGGSAQKTVSIVCHGANQVVVDEAERSLHDALCVVRSLVKKRAFIPGGGCPEMELTICLTQHARTLQGVEGYCFQAYANALEIIPITLAENAGLNPIRVITELRNRHAQGDKYAGINVKKGTITNMLEENVIQPLLVSTSAIELATETVCMILKIDDIVQAR